MTGTRIWIAILCTGLLSLGACRPQGETREMSQAEALAALESDAPPLFLDVRTPEEYAAGHVPGALNVPHDQVAARLAEISAQRERLVVVYCERGGRASQASAVLAEAGLEHLAHLTGDMSAWRAADLPLETAPQSP